MTRSLSSVHQCIGSSTPSALRYGRAVAVRDGATGSAYWRLTDVDGAGRFGNYAVGNQITRPGGATVRYIAGRT